MYFLYALHYPVIGILVAGIYNNFYKGHKGEMPPWFAGLFWPAAIVGFIGYLLLAAIYYFWIGLWEAGNWIGKQIKWVLERVMR